jgi:hypothetical protein
MENNDNSRDGLLFSKINFPDLLMACAQTKSGKLNKQNNENKSNSSSNSSLKNNNNNNNFNDNNSFSNNKRQNFNSNNNRNRKNSNNNQQQQQQQQQQQRSLNSKLNFNYSSNNNNRNFQTNGSSASIYYSNLSDKDLNKRNYFKSNLDESKLVKNNNEYDMKQKAKENRPNVLNNNNNQVQFQQAPFQPPAYHHYHNHKNNNNNNNNNLNKQKVLIEKYHHKFNLISFILLRKKDEYLNDYKYYFNDQSYYQQVDYFIETRNLTKLNDLFLNNKIYDELDPIKTLLETEQTSGESSSSSSSKQRLTNFTNSYNCNLFVYTIRKCLENELIFINKNDENNNDSLIKSINDSKFLVSLIEMLFSNECRPDEFNLIDGDYPKRNIMHYAAQYNCTLIPKLILKNNGETNEKNELILIQLCMQTDFNGNTPAHLAAINNSIDTLKLIHSLCIKCSQLIYNDDGLNPFLLACRYSSVEFIQYLVESSFLNLNTVDEIETKVSLDLLSCRDKINAKNCLHFACGRGCGNDALNTVKYLTKLTTTSNEKEDKHLSLNELIGTISPLVGSIYHVAASNLTRLSTLWYLLDLYPIDGLFHLNSISNHFAESILNRLDFREFTCIDCLIDSIMNLREMAPPNCKSLSSFFNDLVNQSQSVQQQQIVQNKPASNFKTLLNNCVYKLLIEFRANIYNLPRIRNQWQLVEFCKLLVFMSKFGSNTNQRFIINASNFNTVYFQNFEAFCLNFINKFIICGDLLPWFTLTANNNNKTSDNNEKKFNKKLTNNEELYYILNEIMLSLYELTWICILSGPHRYTHEFKQKIYSFFCAYLQEYEKFTNNSEILQQQPKINELRKKCDADLKAQPFSLKNLCRIKINHYIFDYSKEKSLNKSHSALSQDYLLFKLPKKYSELINFLSFNLIDDLYN